MKSFFYSKLSTKQSKKELLESLSENMTEQDVKNLVEFIQNYDDISKKFSALEKDLKKLDEALSHPKVKKVLQEGVMDSITGGLGGIWSTIKKVIPNLKEIKQFIDLGGRIMPILSVLVNAISGFMGGGGISGAGKAIGNAFTGGEQQPAQPDQQQPQQ